MFKGKVCCRCSCRGQPSTLEERKEYLARMEKYDPEEETNYHGIMDWEVDDD